MTAPIVRATFFAHVRAAGLCGPNLSQVEVDGLDGILDTWERLGWPPDLRHVAYTLATAWHECRLNLSLREDGLGRGHQYSVPINGRAYYGRGAGQLTWLDNYRTFGRLLGLDLVGNPDLALVPETSAAILVIGARDGLFRRGRTLAQFFNPQTDDPVGARDIINGDVAKNGALNPPATFLWRIAGSSMEGAGIYDRDLACVDRSLKPSHGSIVVAAIDGEMSCKRLVIDGNVARLAFCNPDLPAFAVDEFGEGVIWGAVRFSIRWHVARGQLS